MFGTIYKTKEQYTEKLIGNQTTYKDFICHRIEKNIEVDESFGLITIDWGIMNPSQILLEIKDVNGNSTVMKKIPLTVLQRGILKISND